MKLNVSTVMMNMQGQPLREVAAGMTADEAASAPIMTVGSMLSQACLCGPAQGHTRTPDQQVKRYNMAMDVHEAGKAEPFEVELTADQAAELKPDIARLWSPLASGPLLKLLDGK